MRVAALWRYPVKSLQGEPLDAADVGPLGLAGDRSHALFDLDTGVGLSAKRVPELLLGAAALRSDGAVVITLPDGTGLTGTGPDVDAALSAWLGRRVALRRAKEPGARSYEVSVDAEDEAGGGVRSFEGPAGAFHDTGRAAVSLVGTASLRTWDARRFRPNVVLDTGVDGEEEALEGWRVALGGVELDVRRPLSRCVMVTRAQPGGVERDLAVLRTVTAEREGRLAVASLVARSGRVAVGDELRPLVEGPSAGRVLVVDLADVEAGVEAAAPGGVVTVELCGGWDHGGRCRVPHHTAVERWEGGAGRIRVLSVADDDAVPGVAAAIERALGADGRWRVAAVAARPPTDDEVAQADRMVAGAGQG